jgi:hypothetical protein
MNSLNRSRPTSRSINHSITPRNFDKLSSTNDLPVFSITIRKNNKRPYSTSYSDMRGRVSKVNVIEPRK